jgi:hypothetical protein
VAVRPAPTHGAGGALSSSRFQINHPSRYVAISPPATGWTSRLVARCGAHVVGVDIASDLLAAATARAKHERLDIEYRIGDEGYRTELGVTVPRQYLITLGTRK